MVKKGTIRLVFIYIQAIFPCPDHDECIFEWRCSIALQLRDISMLGQPTK